MGEREHQPRCEREQSLVRPEPAPGVAGEGSEGESSFTLVPNEGTDEVVPRTPRHSPSFAGPHLGAGLRVGAGLRIGPWTLEREIGRGGMATVYLARHSQLGTLAALKLLHGQFSQQSQRLILEGRLQANLRHPNVLAVHDVEWFDHSLALVLEYVDGPDLQHRLRGGPRLNLAQIEAIVRGVLDGVQAAHRAGIVHRDLKPSNVLLAGPSEAPVPKVSDFGIAKFRGGLSGQGSGPRWLGTPGYMAPEQFIHADRVDQRADIYALGCIFYEMVTGRPVYNGPVDWGDILRRARAADPPLAEYIPITELAPDTPPRIVAAIESALQPDVERRPESCEALLAIWDGRHPGTASRVGALLAMEILAEGEGQARAIREICAQDAAIAGLDQRFHRRETAEDGILFFPTPGEAMGYAQQFRELVQHRSANLTVRCDLRIAIGAGTRTGAARPADIVRRLVSLAGRDRTLVVGPVREGTCHGWYRLAGLPEPIEVYEVQTAQRDRAADPPGDTVAAWRVERHESAHGPVWLPKAAIPHNLLRGASAYSELSRGAAPVRVPSRLTPLVGRDQELLALERAFEEGCRCVHLLGPEGSGKTLLAQHLAWSTLGWWPGGVWLVDVSTARGRFELTELLLWNVEPLTDDAGTEPEDLGPCLARLQRCLLVLDGADRLETDALVMLEQWRAEAPEVHMLLVAATARPLPPDARAISLGPLPVAETSQLLRERLGDRPSASQALSQLATLLGGLPLACELVAGCAGVMELQALAETLERALSGAQPPSFDQILSVALSFAWQQLNEVEQSALLQCTVFEGGFTLQTAARVLDLADPVVALWSRRWLLVAGEDRFDLHPVVRAFLEGQLRSHPGSASASILAAEKRHAAFFASSAALHELRWEIPNLVAACQRSMAGWTSLAVSACLRMREVVGETRVAVEIAASMLGMRGASPLPGLGPAERARLTALAARPRWLAAELARDRRDRTEVANRSLEALQSALALFEEAGDLLGAGEVARQTGDIQRLLGRFTEARESYQVALLAYHDIHHFDADAAILRQLAEMSHALGQLDLARQEYLSALSSTRPDDRAAQGALKLQLARVERDSGQLEAALGLLEEARVALGDDRVALARVDQYRLELERELARSVSRVWGRVPAEEASPESLEPQRRAAEYASADSTERGSTPAPILEVSAQASSDWLVVGRRYRDHGQLGRALEWFGSIRDPARRPRALCEAGAIHRMRGALDQAIASVQSAVAALRRQPSEDPGEAASARHLLAELYELRDQRADTREKLEAELARHIASGECVSEGQTRARLVLHHLELGEIDRALLHCERAVAIHRQVGDPRAEAIDLGNLGNLQYEVGRWDLAASLFQEALVLHREVGNASGEGAVASNLAHLLKLQQRYDEASLWYQRVLEKHRQADRPARLAQTLGNLGDIDRIQGRLESARSRLSDAVLIAEELGDPRLKAVLLGQRASLEARFDLDAAEELFDTATALFCAHPDPVDLGWLLAARAEVALDRGGKGLAHKLLDEIPLLFPPPGAPLLLQRRRLRDRSH